MKLTDNVSTLLMNMNSNSESPIICYKRRHFESLHYTAQQHFWWMGYVTWY